MSSAGTAHTLEVFKFGGTSVGSAENMRRVAQIVHAASTSSALVVVASAMSGVTDLLVTATQQAGRGDVDSIDPGIGE